MGKYLVYMGYVWLLRSAQGHSEIIMIIQGIPGFPQLTLYMFIDKGLSFYETDQNLGLGDNCVV